ncbi:putative DSBA family oxidoreductase [Cladophialophora carrionii]|uniref:Putative DSBA family oxidoreductase n=1 Tax=Cladophialophora carrionii TaxID=86049 RepID=A0A1C1CDH5_9EURO|nr:putative DSBA family oxidoreductase [Cladophialophora carrionii]
MSMFPKKHPEGGKLTIFVDCVSPYSWFGFTNAVRYRPLLKAYGVSVEILPFYLGAARVSAGNPFTPTPKYKEAFGDQDFTLTGEMLGLKAVRPKEFPILSLFAVRVATWVKDHYPAEKFEQTFPAFSVAYWSKGINISKPEGVIEALAGIFSEEEIKDIMKNALRPENKQRVVELTNSAGAFGAPWIQAVNSKGHRRDWFGNDRWDQVFYHLEVPFTTTRIIPPDELEAKAKL